MTNVGFVVAHYWFEMNVQATSLYTQKNTALLLAHITTNTARSSRRVAISDSTMDIAQRVVSRSFSMMHSGQSINTLCPAVKQLLNLTCSESLTLNFSLCK